MVSARQGKGRDTRPHEGRCDLGAQVGVCRASGTGERSDSCDNVHKSPPQESLGTSGTSVQLEAWEQRRCGRRHALLSTLNVEAGVQLTDEGGYEKCMITGLQTQAKGRGNHR